MDNVLSELVKKLEKGVKCTQCQGLNKKERI